MAANGKQMIKRLLLLLLLVVSYGKMIHAGEYKFCYNMKKGDIYRYKYTSVTNGVSNKDGEKENGENVVTLIFTLQVDEITNKGNSICTARIDSFSWDRNDQDSKASNNVYDKFTGKRVKLTLSPEGKTLKSEPIDNIEIPLSGSLGGNKPGLSPEIVMRYPVWILPDEKIKMNSPIKKSHIDTTIEAEKNTSNIKKIITEYNLCGNKKIDNYDCVEIRITITETGESMVLLNAVAANLSYTSKKYIITYFAPSEGILVQSSEEGMLSQEANTTSNNYKTVSKLDNTTKSTLLLLR